MEMRDDVMIFSSRAENAMIHNDLEFGLNPDFLMKRRRTLQHMCCCSAKLAVCNILLHFFLFLKKVACGRTVQISLRRAPFCENVPGSQCTEVLPVGLVPRLSWVILGLLGPHLRSAPIFSFTWRLLLTHAKMAEEIISRDFHFAIFCTWNMSKASTMF